MATVTRLNPGPAPAPPGDAEFWAHLRQQCLAWHFSLPKDAPSALWEIVEASEQGRLATRLYDLAIDRAEETGIAPRSPQASALLEEAFLLVRALIAPFPAWQSITPAQKGDARRNAPALTAALRMSSTASAGSPAETIRLAGALEADHAAFAAAITRYVRSPYADPVIDRLITRALLDLEFTRFIAKAPRPARAPLPRQSGTRWAMGRLFDSLRAAVIAALLFAGAYLGGLYPPALATLGALALGTLVICRACLALGRLLEARTAQEAPPQPGPSLLDLACRAYGEFHTAGPISVPRLHDCITTLSEAGMAWPQATWVLLHDLKRRQMAIL